MRRARHRSHGSAAIELAVLLPLILILWTVPLFLGRVWWHYTVSLGAAQDAQLYLAQIPYSVMADITLVPGVAAAANDIMAAELAELRPGVYPVYHGVYCDSGACLGYTVPDTLQAWTQQVVQDPLYAPETSNYFNTGSNMGIFIATYVSQPYVGR